MAAKKRSRGKLTAPAKGPRRPPIPILTWEEMMALKACVLGDDCDTGHLDSAIDKIAAAEEAAGGC